MHVDKAPPPLEPWEPSKGDRLGSWKEIAAYLKRDASTVRRWEEEGLPIRRHVHKKKATVYASKAEIDVWWNEDRARLQSMETAVAGRRWTGVWWATAGVILLGLGLGLGLNVAGVRDRLLG